MPSSKKIISTLLLMLVVYAWYFFTQTPQQTKPLNVPGANTDVALYVQPESGHTPIVDAIDSAKSEVLVEVYLLSDKQVISALEDARSRGVDVKVMLEEHPFGGGDLNNKTKTELDKNTIQTEWSDPAFALTHEKAIIIDQSEVLILSQNLTSSSFSKNREYDVFDTNPSDIQEIRNIFIDDWERKSFSPPANSDVIESPDNSRAALTTLIANAKSSIDMETEDIDDSILINLLSQKAKTLSVRLIVPTLSQVASNKPALQELASAGVQVRTITSPYMHAKTIITDDDKAYTGSINFSTQSLDKNREVGIILTQPDSIQKLTNTFATDWSDASPLQ
jgi:cardiolipin synthase A/B